MDVHVIVKLKSSYESWYELFTNDGDKITKICDESRTLVGKANDTTALVTLFDVDMEAMGKMMMDPEFHKLTKDYVEEHSAYIITPVQPPA